MKWRVAFSILLLCFSSPTSAQGLSADAITRLNELFLMSTEWVLHAKAIGDAAADFDGALRYAEEAKRGERPHDPTGKYGDVVASYVKASQAIQAEKLATEFDEAPFSVSWKEFIACHTRDDAVDMLQKYSQALGDANQRGEEARVRYAALLAETERTSKAAYELQDILRDGPLLNLFAMDWFAIENQVKPAIVNLSNAVTEKTKALTAALTAVRSRKTNLDSNLQTLANADCNIAGSWRGAITIEDMLVPMELAISGEPGNYKVTYSLRNKRNNAPCVLALNATERRLELRPSCKPPANTLRMDLRFSASYATLTGVQSDDMDVEVRFPISLQRH